MPTSNYSHQSSSHSDLDHNRLENDETTKQEQSAKKSRLACAVVLSACLMGAGCGAANIDVAHPDFDPVTDADAGTDAGTDASISSDEAIDSQKSNIEWLPGYPISKKIAVIINGDSREKRHKKNVERAINLFQIQEFDEIFVAQDASVKDGEGIRQYNGTKNGLNKLFEDLKKSLKKDSLVFVYGTGHGQSEENGAIALDEPIGVEEVQSYTKVIKEGGSRIVAVFDSCYSGSFPNAIIEDEKLEGVAMSPGVSDTETCCNFFTPYFFENLEKGIDLNNDGKTELNEAFVSAMQTYRHKTSTEEYGEYMRSKTELSLENLDHFMNSEKTLIIDVNATWCGPCKTLSEQLAKLTGFVGEQIEVVTITDDKNPEAKELYERLNIQKPEAFPLMLIKKPGADSDLDAFSGAKSYSKLTKLLESQYGVEVDNEQFFSTLVSSTIERYPKYESEISLFIELLGAEQAWLLGYIDWESVQESDEMSSDSPDVQKTYLIKYQEDLIRKIASRRPKIAMAHSDTFINQPYAESIIRTISKKNPDLALKFSDKFKDQPYYEEVLEKAVRTYSRSYKNDALEYSDRFKDKPYAESIILTLAKKYPDDALRYSDKFKDQPYYAKVLEEATRIASEDYPDDAIKYSDKFKDQPFYVRVLRKSAPRAARISPGNTLQYSDKLKDQPYYARILKKAAYTAAKKHPVDALKYSDKFKDKPYYAEVLEKAVHTTTRRYPTYDAIKYVDKFKDQPYAGEIIYKISEKKPDLVIKYSDKFKDQPYAESVIQVAAKEKPTDALIHFDKFKDQPYAESIIRTVAEKYPVVILKYSDKFKDQPYHAEVLEKAVRISAVQFPDRAFVFSDEYKDQPYYEEMLEKVTRIGAEKFPTLLITHFDKFKDQLYAEEVIRIVCEKEPIYAMVYSKKFKDQTYYAEVLEKAVRIGVEKDPVEVFEKSYNFKDQPYHEEVLEQVISETMERLPIALVTYQNIFKDKPYYEEVLEEAIRKSIYFSGDVYGIRVLFAMVNPGIFGPVGIVEFSPKLKDKPYYEEVLEEAVREVLEKYPKQIIFVLDKFKDQPYAKEVVSEVVRKVSESGTRLSIKGHPDLKELPYYEDLLKIERDAKKATKKRRRLRREHKNKR